MPGEREARGKGIYSVKKILDSTKWIPFPSRRSAASAFAKATADATYQLQPGGALAETGGRE